MSSYRGWIISILSNIKQKMAWNICYIIHPQYRAISKWVNINKTQWISVTARYLFQENKIKLKFNHDIFNYNTQEQLLKLWKLPLQIISKSIEFELCDMKSNDETWFRQMTLEWFSVRVFHLGKMTGNYLTPVT